MTILLYSFVLAASELLEDMDHVWDVAPLMVNTSGDSELYRDMTDCQETEPVSNNTVLAWRF